MIEDKNLFEAIEKARNSSKKRRFVQTFEVIIIPKGIDATKPENKIEEYIVLPYGIGKKRKIAAFVDKTYEKAKEIFDLVIKKDEFEELAQQKRKIKKIAKNYDYFVAEAPVMPLVGKYFGKYLAPRGKMPSPKGKMIFPPTADLKPLRENLDKMVVARLDKKHRTIQLPFGSENMKDEELVENLKKILNTVINAFPRGKENLKSVIIKLTMGPAIRVI